MKRRDTHLFGADHLLQHAAPIRNLPTHWTRAPIVVGWIELSCRPLQVGPWLDFSTASIVVARCLFSGAILYVSPCFDEATPTPAQVMSAALSHVATATKQANLKKRKRGRTAGLSKPDLRTAASDDTKTRDDRKRPTSIREHGGPADLLEVAPRAKKKVTDDDGR